MRQRTPIRRGRQRLRGNFRSVCTRVLAPLLEHVALTLSFARELPLDSPVTASDPPSHGVEYTGNSLTTGSCAPETTPFPHPTHAITVVGREFAANFGVAGCKLSDRRSRLS